MGKLTLIMQHYNEITCVADIYLTEAAAIKKLEDLIEKRVTVRSVQTSLKEGECITVNVDDRDLKKIIKQGYLYIAFDYHLNQSGYGVPLAIKASKSGLVKAFRAMRDPEATEHKIFRDCFNAAAYTLDKNNIPVGFSAFHRFNPLKIDKT